MFTLCQFDTPVVKDVNGYPDPKFTTRSQVVKYPKYYLNYPIPMTYG